ncbi:hypothetical protein [Baekduia sp.]|uniref:hypothetical protein n=1 Tax=Baekduia sp. TaxID=2600305 RepID=UPI002D1F9EAA|nr:hypothetical protein [Baekduia sp.]
MALASAQEVRLGGWGPGGRPERLRSLDLYCRSTRGHAAVAVYEEDDCLPFDVQEAQLLDTAASLDAASDSEQMTSARRTVVIDIDGVPHQAEASVQGALAAVVIRGAPQAALVLIATSGLDVGALHLTTKFDFDTVIVKTLGA